MIQCETHYQQCNSVVDINNNKQITGKITKFIKLTATTSNHMNQHHQNHGNLDNVKMISHSINLITKNVSNHDHVMGAMATSQAH